MYRSIDIADYFIDKSRGEGIKHINLHHFVYTSYGVCLAMRDKVLVDDDEPTAWLDGVVFPKLYEHVLGDDLEDHKWSLIVKKIMRSKRKIDKETLKVLDFVWDKYEHCINEDIDRTIRQTVTPWSIIWKRSRDRNMYYSRVIPNTLIESYYSHHLYFEPGV